MPKSHVIFPLAIESEYSRSILKMGRMTLETRRRVVNLSKLGMRLKAIKHRLEEEGIQVSKTGLCMLLKKYKETGTVQDRFRPRNQSKKLTLEHLALIDAAVDKDDEVSNGDLCKMLREECGIVVSKSTVQRAKKHLG